MNYMLKGLFKLGFIGLSLLLIFSSVKEVKGYVLFSDEFEIKDSSRWVIDDHLGFSSASGGVLSLGSTELSFPHYINKSDIPFGSRDFSIEVKFRYDKADAMGSGIGIGFTGTGGYPFYQFGIWWDTTHSSFFLYRDYNNVDFGFCNSFGSYEDLSKRIVRYIDFGDIWHTLNIEKEGTLYDIYIDKNSNPDPIYTTEFNQCVPENIWFGNSLTGGRTSWSFLSLDYIKVEDVGISSTNKIILLPGLGASWNTRAMVYNENVGDNEWVMTPLVKNYNGLVKAFEDKGLVKGTDFWVWNYDWRRPIADISNSLGNFIDDKIGVGSTQKVDLVGHSLGGMTARIWAQDNLVDPRLGKVLSLGSPHYGAIKAYEAWSGASFSDKLDFSTIALNILLQLQKQNFETDFDTIRAKVPALKDIIPTFDFIKKNGVVVLVASLESQNLWLAGKNLTVSTLLLDILRAVVAMGVSTKEWINLGDRTVFDKVLGVWPDGKPTSFEYGEGDGTVLKKSAKFDGDVYDEINASHGDMVDKGISEVFTELGLGTVADGTETYDLADTLVFYLGSPVEMRVKCDDQDSVPDEEGFVVIKDQNYDNCQVSLVGTGSGVYHLVMGKTDEENSWKYFEGEIDNGQIKLININPSDGSIVLDTNSEELVYELIKRDLSLLRGMFADNLLADSLEMANRRNVDGLVDKFFAFRLKKRETKISERIVNNLEILLSIKYENVGSLEANNWLVRARREKGLLDRNSQSYVRRRINPTVFGSMSYLMLGEKLAGAEDSMVNQNYAETMARANLVIKLIKEVW